MGVGRTYMDQVWQEVLEWGTQLAGRALSDRSQTEMCVREELREKAGEMEIGGGPGTKGRVKLRELSHGEVGRGVGWVRRAPSGPGPLSYALVLGPQVLP